MSSRVAASAAYATGLGKHMVVHSREEYEDRAVALANSLNYPAPAHGVHPGMPAGGELLELRRRLFLSRKSMPLFDTARWTRNLEKGYVAAWRRWVEGKQFRAGCDEDACIRVSDDEGDFEPVP
ncbi:hypothetical protein ID866_8411 [Astraeus odoratus]|nr:hypothetical protein ID866_8411 [Astraeus odoratus]